MLFFFSILILESDFEFKTFQYIDRYWGFIDRAAPRNATLQLLIKVANFCQRTVIGLEQSMPRYKIFAKSNFRRKKSTCFKWEELNLNPWYCIVDGCFNRKKIDCQNHNWNVQRGKIFTTTSIQIIANISSAVLTFLAWLTMILSQKHKNHFVRKKYFHFIRFPLAKHFQPIWHSDGR